MAQTYYELLGVPAAATAKEISTAFKRKAREVHPDRVGALAPSKPFLRRIAEEAFKDLNEARGVLLDPGKRRMYDAALGAARGATEVGYSPPSQPQAAARQAGAGKASPSQAPPGASSAPTRATPAAASTANGFISLIMFIPTMAYLAWIVVAIVGGAWEIVGPAGAVVLITMVAVALSLVGGLLAMTRWSRETKIHWLGAAAIAALVAWLGIFLPH